ncbi:MAG: cell division protein ZapA [Lepagella sp.]
MNDSDKIIMTLNIGDQRIQMSSPFARQEFVRVVESEVDGLYRKWRKKFPTKDDGEILAMAAYQFASFYYELKERYEKAADIAADCLKQLEEESAATDSDED